MSFWDKVGDAWDGIKGAAGAIGGAFATANHFATEDIPLLSPILKGAESGAGSVGDAINTAYTYGIARPVSTALQVGQDWGTLGHAMTNMDDWRQAWNRSESITPGQATVIDYNATYGTGPSTARTFNMDPATVASRENFFHNTWPGQISSGALDLALNIGADPTVLAGKALKANEIARTVLKSNAERDAAFAVNAGEAAAPTQRVGAISQRMDKLFSQIDGKTAAEIAMHPVVKSADQGGAFAYMFGRINETIVDDAERKAAQRTVYGAMVGHEPSIQALKDQHGLLANELQRLSDTPAPSLSAAKFSWEDGGQGVLFDANASVAPEIAAKVDEVNAELSRIENVLAGKGSTSRVGGTLEENVQANAQLNRMGESYLTNGLGNRAIRVVGGAVANRLPGNIAIKDPVQGFTDLENTLRQAKYIDGPTRKDLLNSYVNAATDGDRQRAVMQAENSIVQSTMDHYGVDPAAAKAMIAAGQTRRDAVFATLKSRLYSAADDDKFVHMVDPEADEIYAVSRPLLQSQIEDHHPIIDPRELDRVVKANTNNRMLERIAGQAGDTPKNLAGAGLDKLGSAQMIASDGLSMATRLWKDSALMRLAYPIRVQVDSQMRLMAHMGAASYLGSTLGVVKAQSKYALSAKGADKLSLRNLFKEGDYEKSLTGMLTDAGIHEDDIPVIVRKIASEDGGMADLASEMSNAQIARFRSTGEWGTVDPANPNWAAAYTRAVNNQIRNSPVAMKAIEGGDLASLKQFVRENPATRKEWNNLAGSNGNDLDAWLQRVQAHVDHYLPEAGQRATIMDRGVNQADLDKWFGVDRQDARMPVHGESYAPTMKSAMNEWYERVRNRWYKFAAEVPETVLARAPLYADAFKKHLVDVVERQGGKDVLTPTDLTAARQTADRLARREVGQVLFDASHTSNLAHSMRYISPFFAAWEDMMKKWGGLFYDKPWQGADLAKAWDAPNNAGFVVDENGNTVDAQGNHFDPHTGRQLDPVKDKFLIGKQELVTIPSALLPKAVKDATGADSLRINKNSFNIVFQGDPWWLPGAGPIVQVPVNELIKNSFPEYADNPIVAAALPFGVSDNPVQDQFLPSWIRQAKNALGSTQDYANVQALLLAQETTLVQQGKRGPIKSGEIAEKARNWFILRAITANASPVSMAPTPKTQFYIDQAHIYRQKYGANWQDNFYKDFPQWYDMSLSLSNNETGIVSTLDAKAVANDPKIRPLIAANPEFGWMFVGPANQYGQTPGSAFSQAAYAWEEQPIGYGQSKSFRGKSSPQEALAKAESSKGWIQYQGAMTKLNLILEQRGLHSFSQKGAEDLNTAKKAVTDALMQANPSWAKDFNQRDQGKLFNALVVAHNAMQSNPELAKRSDFAALSQYMEARSALRQILASRKQTGLASNPDVQAALDAVRSALVQNNLGFEQMANRLGIENDNLSQGVPGAG